MWFKNLTLMRFTHPCLFTATKLSEQLSARRFSPCGVAQASSAGWVPPAGPDHLPLVHGVGTFLMLRLRVEERLLPAGVINEAVAAKVEEIESSQGTKVNRRWRNDIRDQIVMGLLPRAFVQSRYTYGYIDTLRGWLIIDTASPGKADEFVSILRQTVGSLPVVPLSVQERPAAILTHWASPGADVPAGFMLEDEGELRSPEEDGGVIRFRREDPCSDEIAHHLESGKEVVRLALSFRNRQGFVLDESLTIKRLRFFDVVQERAAEVETDDPVARFDSDFALMGLELVEFLTALVAAFGGEKKQEV